MGSDRLDHDNGRPARHLVKSQGLQLFRKEQQGHALQEKIDTVLLLFWKWPGFKSFSSFVSRKF